MTIEWLEAELLETAKRVRGCILGRVQGLGLRIGFEPVRDHQSKDGLPELRDRIEAMGFDGRILLPGCADQIRYGSAHRWSLRLTRRSSASIHQKLVLMRSLSESLIGSYHEMDPFAVIGSHC